MKGPINIWEWRDRAQRRLPRAVFDYLDENSVLEQEPLRRLASSGQIAAYKHHGFWNCMDTYKDAVALDVLWNTKRAQWKLWQV